MLGSDLMQLLTAEGKEAKGLTHAELDVTNPEDIAKLSTGEFGEPDWIVNCTAYTAVDNAETETREATELNTIAPGYLATAAEQLGAKFIHISTDFVFDGNATKPYREDAPTNPLGAYGRTKRDGEEAVMGNNQNALIVRTAWLYGPNGNSFPKTMIKAHLAGRQLKVVADQTGCPTYTADVAQFIVERIDKNDFPGIYHCVGHEAMTWRDFAIQAIEAYQRANGQNISVDIEPIKTEDWPTPAQRPKYSVLADTKTDFKPRTVYEALAEFVSKLDLSK